MVNLSSFNVDWNSVEEVQEYKPLAAGTYAAKIVKSEFVKTKKDDDMLKMTFEVLGKSGKNKKLFENYMFTCKANPDTVKFALGKIKALAKLIDLDFDNMEDTSEFHGKPVGIKIKVTKSEQYGDGNAITSFLEYSEDLLEGGEEESVEVEQVDEIVEDDVPELVADEVSLKPEEIKALKKPELLKFIKEKGLDLDLKGKKISEVKDMVIDALFGAEEVADDEDIIIDD